MILKKTIKGVQYTLIINKLLGYSCLKYKDLNGQNCENWKQYKK